MRSSVPAMPGATEKHRNTACDAKEKHQMSDVNEASPIKRFDLSAVVASQCRFDKKIYQSSVTVLQASK